MPTEILAPVSLGDQKSPLSATVSVSTRHTVRSWLQSPLLQLIHGLRVGFDQLHDSVLRTLTPVITLMIEPGLQLAQAR